MPNIEHLELRALLFMLLLRHAVGHNDLVKGARIDTLNGISTENPVCDESVDFCRALLLEQLCGASDSIRCVREVIDENSSAIGNVSY